MLWATPAVAQTNAVRHVPQPRLHCEHPTVVMQDITGSYSTITSPQHHGSATGGMHMRHHAAQRFMAQLPPDSSPVHASSAMQHISNLTTAHPTQHHSAPPTSPPAHKHACCTFACCILTLELSTHDPQLTPRNKHASAAHQLHSGAGTQNFTASPSHQWELAQVLQTGYQAPGHQGTHV